MPQVVPADPSPYATLGQSGANANLLGPMATFASTLNQLNQNALFQQTFRARQAMGPLAQASVDPQTGQMDYNKFATMISTHPETAFMAPEVINQLVQRQLTQAELVKTNLDIEAKRRDTINNQLGSLVNLGPNVKKTDVMKAIVSPEMNGIIPMQQAVSMLATLPDDGEKLATWVQQHAMASAGAANALDYVRGQWQEATMPDGSKVGGFASPTSGFTPMKFAQPAGIGPAPADMSATSGGAPSPAAAGGGSPAYAATGPAPNVSMPAAQMPNAGGQPSAAMPGAPVVQALSPYREKALGDVADYEKDVNTRAQSANQLLALFSQVQDYMKDFTPGGGTELRGRLAQIAQAANMPQDVVDSIAKGDLGSVQAANKLFFGVGSQIMAQLIHSSGGRLTQTEWAQGLSRGSPNTDLDARGIAKIMGSMRELAHYSRMEQDYFNAKKNLPNYDLTHAQNDWQNVLGEIIDRRSKRGAQQ